MKPGQLLEEIPANLEDVVLTLVPVIMEIIAATSPDPETYLHRMEDIGSRLLTMSANLTNPRSKATIDTLARLLISIEDAP